MCPETRNESAIIENARAPKKNCEMSVLFKCFPLIFELPSNFLRSSVNQTSKQNSLLRTLKFYFFLGSLLLMEMIC